MIYFKKLDNIALRRDYVNKCIDVVAIDIVRTRHRPSVAVPTDIVVEEV